MDQIAVKIAKAGKESGRFDGRKMRTFVEYSQRFLIFKWAREETVLTLDLCLHQCGNRRRDTRGFAMSGESNHSIFLGTRRAWSCKDRRPSVLVSPVDEEDRRGRLSAIISGHGQEADSPGHCNRGKAYARVWRGGKWHATKHCPIVT